MCWLCKPLVIGSPLLLATVFNCLIHSRIFKYFIAECSTRHAFLLGGIPAASHLGNPINSTLFLHPPVRMQISSVVLLLVFPSTARPLTKKNRFVAVSREH